MTEELRDQMRGEAAHISGRVSAGTITGLWGLWACRERAGLSITELSRNANIRTETYRAWESGKTWPNAYYLPIIAKELGCSIEELYLGPVTDEEGGTP